MSGFAFAASELSLVVFTTLAPAGALAFAVMGAPLLRASLDGEVRARLSKLLCIPLVVAMVGLLAATTHLGNPDNALYVLTGIGRSPLSTEVACAVAFLAVAGVFWLLTFSLRFALAAQRAWLACAMVAAAVFVGAVALAYRQPTIPTWSMWQVPVSLCLNAVTSGAVLGLAGLAAAHAPLARRWATPLLVAAGAAVAAGAVVYALQGADYAALRNSVVSADQLVPGFWAMVAGYVLLCAAGVAVAAVSLRGGAGKRAQGSGKRAVAGGASSGKAMGEGPSAEGAPAPSGRAAAEEAAGGSVPAEGASAEAAAGSRAAVRGVVVACLLVLAGVFIMRFAFYMSHMTVGISV